MAEFTSADLHGQWFKAESDRVQDDLLAVLRRHTATLGLHVVATAMVEATGSVCATIIASDPVKRATILKRLDELHMHLSTVGQPTQ